jgi:hypothetical protein
MCKKRNRKSHYHPWKKHPHMLTLENLRKRTKRRKRNSNFRPRLSQQPNPGLKLLARLCNPRHLGTTRSARITQRHPFPKLMHRKTRDKLFHLLLQRKVSSLHRTIFSSIRSSIERRSNRSLHRLYLIRVASLLLCLRTTQVALLASPNVV